MDSRQHPLLVSLDLKEENKSCTDGRPKRQKVMTTMVLKKKKRSSNGRKILKMRRAQCNGIRRRVRTLKRLIPNSDSDSVKGLDGLFRDTADYILCLQNRVRLMQMMVKALADCNE